MSCSICGAKGKKVVEIRPAVEWNKGEAVSLLVELINKESEKKDFIPLYLGDDLTDEDAFKTINQFDNGISIIVGENRIQSLARYFLESTAEVEEFLASLLIAVSSNCN